MELNKIDEQIKALQKKKKEATKKQDEQIKALQNKMKEVFKKQEEKIKSEQFNKLDIDFEKFSKILNDNKESHLELFINGKPLKEYYQDNN